MKLYEDYMKIEFQVVYDFMLNRLADKAVQAGIFYLTNPQEQTLTGFCWTSNSNRFPKLESLKSSGNHHDTMLKIK